MAGYYTFTQFKDMLKFELGERDDLESHSSLSNLYGEWINIAYTTLTTRDMFWGTRVILFFPELMASDTSQSTIDGRNYISTPSTCLYLEGIWDRTNDRKLTGISWREYMEYTSRTATGSEAAPTRYARRGSRIYLYPQPDAAYDMTIYHRKRVTRLDGSTYNVTELGSEWDEPILRLAVTQSLLRLKRYDEVKPHKEEFMDLVAGLAGLYANEKKDWENQLIIGLSSRNKDDYR